MPRPNPLGVVSLDPEKASALFAETGLTYRGAPDALKMTPQSVKDAVAGRPITLKTWLLFAEYMGVPPTELL